MRLSARNQPDATIRTKPHGEVMSAEVTIAEPD